jgi:hypothetical protein
MKIDQMIRFLKENCAVKVTLMLTSPSTRTPQFVTLFFEQVYQRLYTYSSVGNSTVPLSKQVSITFQPLSKDKSTQLEQKLKQKTLVIPPFNLVVTVSEDQQIALNAQQDRLQKVQSRRQALHQQQLGQYQQPSSSSSQTSKLNVFDLIRQLQPSQQYTLKDKRKRGGMKEYEKPVDPDRSPEVTSDSGSSDLPSRLS